MKLYRSFLPTLLIALTALLLGSLIPVSGVLGQEGPPPGIAPNTLDVSSSAGSPAAASSALGTAFTYQGNLRNNSQPINATCSFRFSLWDALTGGTQHGSTQNVNSVQVQGGLFSVDIDFGNEFTGDARWLQTAVQCPGDAGFSGLSPRKPLNAVPYALGLRPGAVIGDVRINGRQNIHLPNSSTQNLLVERNGLVPSSILRLVEGSPIIQMDDSSNGAYIRANLPNNAGSLQFGRAANVGTANPNYSPYIHITGDGKVGIGTLGPTNHLDVSGPGDQSLSISTTDSPHSVLNLLAVSSNNSTQSQVQFKDRLSMVAPLHGNTIMTLLENGKVGIGTTSPANHLDISGPGDQSLSISTTDSPHSVLNLLAVSSNNSTQAQVQFEDRLSLVAPLHGNTIMTLLENGNVGIGITAPQAKLDIAGTTRTDVLQIDGGADLAEPFAVAGQSKPGMVVSIDPDRIGQLRIADKAYDRTVAGVISGAGGLKPGLTMEQPEVMQGETHPVALTGRVYVWADASFGAIQPGYLLTTSTSPGYAMKVSDYAQAQGAILGKAMSRLEKGKGLVLVLVSLQ